MGDMANVFAHPEMDNERVKQNLTDAKKLVDEKMRT